MLWHINFLPNDFTIKIVYLRILLGIKLIRNVFLCFLPNGKDFNYSNENCIAMVIYYHEATLNSLWPCPTHTHICMWKLTRMHGFIEFDHPTTWGYCACAYAILVFTLFLYSFFFSTNHSFFTFLFLSSFLSPFLPCFLASLLPCFLFYILL